MAKLRFFDIAARGNVLAAWSERFARLGRALGINGWISGFAGPAIAIAYQFMSHIVGGISWWFAPPVGLIVAICVLKAYVAVKMAMAVRGIRPLDLQQIGRDCVKFRADVMEFLVGRVDTAPGRASSIRLTGSVDAETRAADWARNVDYSNQTRARTVEKFAHRAVANAHLLSMAGIKAPNLWGFDHNAATVAVYIGAIGELLERGLLAEARAMNPEEQRRLMIHMG